MASWIVLQPDRKLARFSSIVDDFTDLNMQTFGEAVESLTSRGFTEDGACIAIWRGLRDEDSHGTPRDGLHRWRDALRTIAIAHGGGKARQRAWQVRKAARNAGA